MIKWAYVTSLTIQDRLNEGVQRRLLAIGECSVSHFLHSGLVSPMFLSQSLFFVDTEEERERSLVSFHNGL